MPKAGTPFWAWNSSLDKEELEEQIDIFKEMGFGGESLLNVILHKYYDSNRNFTSEK